MALSLRAGTVVIQLGAGDDALSVANAELGHHFAVGAEKATIRSTLRPSSSPPARLWRRSFPW